MTNTFTSEFYSENRKRLQRNTGAKVLVFAANGLLQRSADTTFPFRQDSNFWYLTGIEEPDYVLVISEDGEFLIEPKRSEHRDQWDGEIDSDLLKDSSGISTILDYHDGWNKLDKLIKKHGKVHTIAPAEPYFEHFGFYANPARATLLKHIAQHKKAQVVDVRKQLARQRQVKQAPELDAIKFAINQTVTSLSNVKKRLSHYQTEAAVVADLTRDFLNAGFRGHAYAPIVAYGKNAATIHYVDVDSKIGKNGLVLMDVGAEYRNYSADITRTFSVAVPTKREISVHASVEAVKSYAVSLLKPGIKLKEYEELVDKRMGKELKKLGLIKDESDKKGIKKYYPHLVSHHLGLDTHDAADYTMPLEPGMVLTVEPGIYIPDENIGIRLEDDYLITESGNLNLSGSLPTSLT